MAATQQASPATDNTGAAGAAKADGMDFHATAAAAVAANPALAMMQAAYMNPMMLNQMNGSAAGAATNPPYYFGGGFPAAGYPGAGFLPTSFPFANPLQIFAAGAQNTNSAVPPSISAPETTKPSGDKEERANSNATAGANTGGTGHVISAPRAITPSMDAESLANLSSLLKDNSSAIRSSAPGGNDSLKRTGGSIGNNRLKHSRSETNFLSLMGADLSGAGGGAGANSAVATGNTLGALSQSSSVPNFSAMQGLNGPIAVAAAAAAAAQQAEMDDRELKRQRRKQSNRESARRSRLRKQAECEELGTRVSRIASENERLQKEVRHMRAKYAALEAEAKILRSSASEATLAEAKEAAKAAKRKSEAESEQGENVPVADKASNLEAICEKPDWKSRILQDNFRPEKQSENEVDDEASSQGEK